MQQVIVILVVMASGAWLSLQAYRFVRPRPGGKACAGGCCDGQDQPKVARDDSRRTMMISSDDLRSRLAARKK
jgi:hypothetical protein